MRRHLSGRPGFWKRCAACPGTLILAAAALGCGSSPSASQTQTAASSPPAATAGTLQATDAAPPPGKSGGFDGQRAFEHVRKLVEIGPRPAASEGIHKAQEYIESELRSFGCSFEEDNFSASTPIGTVQLKNIVVKIPGAKRSVILLTTHYDTKMMAGFVGADDGGSSTGLMLEMARTLCGRKNALSIWIAFFDGEEAFREWDKDNDNTYGSRQMAAKLSQTGDLKRVKAMMLADLIGYRDLRIKRDSNSTKWLTDLVWSTASRLGYSRVFVSDETGIEDDHLAFLKRNVPSVDVIDLEIPYWHTPQDTLDKISPQSLAIVGHVFLETVSELEKRFQ
ncbi:MAG TPA: M28 family peptidase [Candidatus Acidoferrales bacterium]|nr:M28 family peptidase [Candidatus Acidoferrales bacterium]